MVHDVSVSECLSEGWQYYKKYMGLTILTLILYIVIVMAGSWIPFFKFLFQFLVAPIIGNGLYFFFLNVGRDSNPKLEDLFAGFQRYGTLIGLNFLYLGVAVVGRLPTIIYAVLYFASLFTEGLRPDNFPWGLFGLAFVNGIILALLLARYWVIYFVVMDEPRIGLFDAVRRAAEISKYNTHNIILYMIAGFFISLALFIALILPALIFGPFVMVGFARMYVKLKAMHDEPSQQPINPAMMP